MKFYNLLPFRELLLIWTFSSSLLPVTAQVAEKNVAASASLRNLAQLTNTALQAKQLQQLASLNHKDSINSINELQKYAVSLGLPFAIKHLTLEQLIRRGTPAILHLRGPEPFVVVASIGIHHTLIYHQDSIGYDENQDIKSLYLQEALVFNKTGVPYPSLYIDNPLRVVSVTSALSQIDAHIKLTNGGHKPLALRIAGTSCTCTEAKLPKTTLAPGESEILSVTMKISGWGSRMADATLRTSDPLCPVALVGLVALMPKSVVPAPEKLSIKASEGQAGSRPLDLLIPTGAVIKKIATRNTFLSIKPTGQDLIEGGTRHHFEVSLAANAPLGSFADEIAFTLQGAVVPQVYVPVTGTVEPDITVSPHQVFLGNVTNGSNVRKTFIVESKIGRTFSIQATTASNPQITMKASSDITAAAHAVELDMAVAGTPGTVIQERVQLNLSNGRTLEIPVVGMIAQKNSKDDLAHQAISSEIEVGKPAPDFSVLDAQGHLQRLADLRGKKHLLLTFFPKCFTGGCAGQLASLEAALPTFETNDTQIIAVSVDPAEEQRSFAAKLGLDFPLIPDTERKLCKLYNAAQTSTDLAARQSVLIDKDGIIRLIDTNVNVRTHGQDMLAKIRQLGLTK